MWDMDGESSSQLYVIIHQDAQGDRSARATAEKGVIFFTTDKSPVFNQLLAGRVNFGSYFLI